MTPPELRSEGVDLATGGYTQVKLVAVSPSGTRAVRFPEHSSPLSFECILTVLALIQSFYARHDKS